MHSRRDEFLSGFVGVSEGPKRNDARPAHLLAPLAQRYGHPECNGRALLNQLLIAAELDVVSRARGVLQDAALAEAVQKILAEGTTPSLNKVSAKKNAK